VIGSVQGNNAASGRRFSEPVAVALGNDEMRVVQKPQQRWVTWPERGEARMKITWRLRMAAAQREAWTGTQMRRLPPSGPGCRCPRHPCRHCSPRSPARSRCPRSSRRASRWSAPPTICSPWIRRQSPCRRGVSRPSGRRSDCGGCGLAGHPAGVTTADGTGIHPDAVTRHFRALVRRLACHRYGTHDLRHGARRSRWAPG
jgi:hypothetical protein